LSGVQYSSLAAFLAHYRALKSASSLALEERSRLAELEKLIDGAGLDARELLSDQSGAAASGEAIRHRERAERRLRSELLTRGVLTG
jgi:hypothetical protein